MKRLRFSFVVLRSSFPFLVLLMVIASAFRMSGLRSGHDGDSVIRSWFLLRHREPEAQNAKAGTSHLHFPDIRLLSFLLFSSLISDLD